MRSSNSSSPEKPRTDEPSASTEADNSNEASLPDGEDTQRAGTDHPDLVEQKKPARRVSISITARGLILGLALIALAAATSIFAYLYFDARSDLNEQARISENNARAEKIALDYAVNAAGMDFNDLNGWKANLVAGTTPELKDKLTEAATSMEQILVPLQWMSTAKPLAAKVRSMDGGAYVVDCFVSVQTKTMQSPDPLQSTATYSVVIDSNQDWQITDVGGIGAVVGQP